MLDAVPCMCLWSFMLCLFDMPHPCYIACCARWVVFVCVYGMPLAEIPRHVCGAVKSYADLTMFDNRSMCSTTCSRMSFMQGQ